MKPEEVYEAFGLVLKGADAVEGALRAVGIELPAWGAQGVLMLLAVCAAGAVWVWFTHMEEWGLLRLAVLVVAASLTIVSLVIPLYWISFLRRPPSGELVGVAVGEVSAGWMVTLYDQRDRVIVEDRLASNGDSFALYYERVLGQVPSHLVATRGDTCRVERRLSVPEVFESSTVELNLACE